MSTPLVGLAMMVKDEAKWLPRTLPTVLPLIDTWTVLDTGSTDGTQKIIRDLLGAKPGELHETEWVNYGHNRTELAALAKDSARWLLTLDADIEVEYHPDLPTFLDEDSSPTTDMWMVELRDGGLKWRLPWLIRGGLDWEYRCPIQEYLYPAGRKDRWLNGLILKHLRACGRELTRFEQEIEILRDDFLASDPRATFYTAQALRQLGRYAEASLVYKTRAGMGGWEEEAWYAAYMAAALDEDVDALYRAWQRRPWRHEPLTEAARLIRSRGTGDDILFIEHH